LNEAAALNIGLKLFAHWLKDRRLILLLDGLDEIRTDEPDRRTMRDRIQKINTYRRANPKIPMVVCTRIAEYRISTDDDAKYKLDFDHAIQLNPLEAEQIHAYIAGEELNSLRELYTEDATVQQLAQIPFLLVTMTYTYRGV
jgi:predicted NACHT family NTPase